MNNVERMRAMYEGGRFDHLFRRDFGYFPQTMQRWVEEGLPAEAALGQPRFNEYFQFDQLPWVGAGVDLGWIEAPLMPRYQEGLLRVEDGHEVVQDYIGRHLMFPDSRRQGVMPRYIRHTVTSRKDWEEEIRPRLNVDTPERWEGFQAKCAEARTQVEQGRALRSANVIGGYMFLRSLIGPVEVLLKFYDEPDLIRDMLKHWRDFTVKCLVRSQKEGGPFFRLFLTDDMCYKSGPLISPKMVEELLIPHYSDIYRELQSRQSEKLHFEMDTDGDFRSIAELYMSAGVDAFTPFEVAAGCDVVELGRKYPNILITGGMDKRVLAKGPKEIDEMMDRIMPAMVKRGRYIPTCDHDVPEDISLANYLHFRRRVLELDSR